MGVRPKENLRCRCELLRFPGHQRSFEPVYGHPTPRSCKPFLPLLRSQVWLAVIDDSAAITLDMRERGWIGGWSLFFLFWCPGVLESALSVRPWWVPTHCFRSGAAPLMRMGF